MAVVDPPEVSSPLEIEAKFRIDDVQQLESLRTVPLLAGRYPLGVAVQVGHVDTYFDTADRRLLRAGRTLRTRLVGEVIYLTAKSIGLRTPKGMHTRDEVEVPAPAVDGRALLLHPAQFPPEIAATVEDLIDPDEPLLPLARLDQARSKRMLSPAESGEAPFAELSIDEVAVLRPGADGWEPVAHFQELEIELLPGAPRSALKEVALAVRALPGLAANDQNKLQQALAALASLPIAQDVPADHCLHVAELCRRVWRQQLAQMVNLEAGVRFSDDSEFVHEMRVATRRARAAARLYASYFERGNKQIARVTRRLRTTGRLLGRVRDLDVALEKLDRHAAIEGIQEHEAIDRLRRHWTAARDRAHALLLDWLDSPRYNRFVAELGRFCETPGAAVPSFAPVPGQPPPPHQLRHVIPSMILNRYEVIRAFEVLFEESEAGGPSVPVETLHALRIECKYLRYHLEFNAALLGAEGQALIATLKALQEHLGDLNDASVSASMLDEAGKYARGETIRAYRTLQDVTLESLRERLPADLKLFLSTETRRALALALARI